MPGVTRVQSRSIRGGSETNITFAPKTDMIYALQQVQARVNQARSAFPPGLDIEVERLTPSLFPIISYNLEGGDPATLYDLARYQIKPLISRVPGVGRVDVQGSDVREIEVIADPARLAAQQMTFADLAAAIQASTTVDAVGRMPERLPAVSDRHRAARRIRRRTSRTSWCRAGCASRDLATVRSGTEDHVRIIAGDGKPAALINITRQIGGNTLRIADSVAHDRGHLAQDAAARRASQAGLRSGGAGARRRQVGARRDAHRRGARRDRPAGFSATRAHHRDQRVVDSASRWRSRCSSCRSSARRSTS